MPDVVSKTIQKFVEFWKDLEKSQKTRLYITSAVIILAVAIGMIYISRPNYVTVISGVDSTELAEMQKVLNEKSIKHKLTDDKSGIMVKMKDSDNTLFEFASAGFLKEGKSFDDALGSIKINTTESDKKQIWNYYDETKIANLIKKFQNIKEASVVVSKPEKSFFIDSTGPNVPKAAVTITPKGTIDVKQVESIVNLVAASVEGLNTKDVKVMDNKGITLNSETGDESIDRTATQYDMRLKRKEEMIKNIRGMLAGQYEGFDAANVMVTPVLDFDTLQQQDKIITNPEGAETGALQSQHQKTTDLKNGTTSAEPGVGTNPGTAPTYPTGTGANSTFKENDITSNYIFNETTKSWVKAVGEVLPEKTTAVVTLMYGDRVKDDSILTQEYMDQIKDIASKASGIPAQNVSVIKLKTVPEIAKAVPIADKIKELINIYGLPVILLLMVIVLMLSMIPKKKLVLQPELAMAGAAGVPGDGSGPRFVVPEVHAESVPEIDLEERSEVKKQIDKFVKQKPEAVAQLLRNWLADEWD